MAAGKGQGLERRPEGPPAQTNGGGGGGGAGGDKWGEKQGAKEAPRKKSLVLVGQEKAPWALERITPANWHS